MTLCSEKVFPKREIVLDLAANVGIVNKSGAWYSYNNSKMGQGSENTKQYLIEHPEILSELDHKVRVYYGLEADETAAASNADQPDQVFSDGE